MPTSRVLRNDAIDRAGVEALADDPAAELRGIVISPGPGRSRRRRRIVDAIGSPPSARIPLLGRLPRHAVDGGDVRRVDRPRADARPRRGVRGDPRWSRAARGDAAVVHGRALPLAVRSIRDTMPAELPRHRDERGRPRGHGDPPPSRCRSRASSSIPRIGADAARARTCSPTSCARPARARRRGSTTRRARSRRADLAEAPGRSMSDHVPRRAGRRSSTASTLSLDEARLRWARSWTARRRPPSSRRCSWACGCAARRSRSSPGSRPRCASASCAVDGAGGHDRRRRDRR